MTRAIAALLLMTASCAPALDSIGPALDARCLPACEAHARYLVLAKHGTVEDGRGPPLSICRCVEVPPPDRRGDGQAWVEVLP